MRLKTSSDFPERVKIFGLTPEDTKVRAYHKLADRLQEEREKDRQRRKVLRMKAAKIGTIFGLLVMAAALFLTVLMLLDKQEENKRLRAGMVNVPSEVEPCLMLTLPAFAGMNLEGAVFNEGTCSKGSKAPVCQICGPDLSNEGRKQIMRVLLTQGPNKEE